MKHTPGPWVMERASNPEEFANVYGGVNRPVAALYIGEAGRVEPDAEDQANARLIAAAPDLLSALKALRDYWNNIAYFGDPVDGDAEANALDRVVDAALAKAER